MLSWRFEASNDLINWHLLDTRVHNLESGEMARKLIPSGATTTWGIDQSVFEKIGYEGFAAFRIVQIEQNSEDSHNMCLSGIEIYGSPTNPEAWRF